MTNGSKYTLKDAFSKIQIDAKLQKYLVNVSSNIIGICSNDSEEIEHEMNKYIKDMDYDDRYSLYQKLNSLTTPLKISYDNNRGFILALSKRLTSNKDYYNEFLKMASEFVNCNKMNSYMLPYIEKTPTPDSFFYYDNDEFYYDEDDIEDKKTTPTPTPMSDITPTPMSDITPTPILPIPKTDDLSYMEDENFKKFLTILWGERKTKRALQNIKNNSDTETPRRRH